MSDDDYTDDDVRPAVRNTDPDTSSDAFEEVSPKRMRRYQRILEVFNWHGNQTCTEVADALGTERDSVSPRLAELALLGKLERTAERRVPRSRPNRRATQIVWRKTT